MARGLLWLPLLIAFIWLAWSGWNEYHKLEAYKIWAENFDNAKFDIYAVLGKTGREITWGKPSRQGMINLESFSLDNVKEINLLVSDRLVALDHLPRKGKVVLEFNLSEPEKSLQIPFTDISLAAKWFSYLKQEWEKTSTSVN